MHTVHRGAAAARHLAPRWRRAVLLSEQKRDDCEAILRIGRFPSPRFVGQPELSPPPQKRRNGFPSKAAALKVPLHTGRTVNDVLFLCLDAVAASACLDLKNQSG